MKKFNKEKMVAFNIKLTYDLYRSFLDKLSILAKEVNHEIVLINIRKMTTTKGLSCLSAGVDDKLVID